MVKQHPTHHVNNERDHIRRMKQPWTNFKNVKQSQIFIEAMNLTFFSDSKIRPAIVSCAYSKMRLGELSLEKLFHTTACISPFILVAQNII